jgi:ADP-dependent NAD(P)H-hydrate dehydratase / NAD(P)H-hydrate epimerase
MILVTTADESGLLDHHTIERGVPSRALMQRAGAAAASEISLRFGELLHRGVAIYAGPGNNGGDAWVVARALKASGVKVRVSEVEAARSADAIAERELAGTFDQPLGSESVVIDGVLGTGARGELRGSVERAILAMERAKAAGTIVVALDCPSGMNADTGKGRCVAADLTLTFGSLKRGLLASRDKTGAIAVLDIGLSGATMKRMPFLADEAWISGRLPGFDVHGHKGDRKRVAIVGGAPGMAGAVSLAGRAALRTGAGLVRLVVHEESMPAVQASVPEALAASWSGGAANGSPDGWAHAIAIGPGLGIGAAVRSLVERAIASSPVPVLVDADALNVFEGDLSGLQAPGSGTLVLTPHPLELARLLGTQVEHVLERRWDIGIEVAQRTGAFILLKGAPTIVTAPDGRCCAVARGTPALATGGSGDVLSGIAATLLAQMNDPFDALVCAAWAHGRAAELVHEGMSPRGTAIGDVIDALAAVWSLQRPRVRYPVLAELPAVPS